MSNRNEQMLRNNYDSFAKGDMSPMMDALTDDVRWHASGGSPLARTYIGKGEVAAFFGKMMELYQGTMRVQPTDMLANERHGIVLTQEEFQYKGETVRFESVHKWEIRDGKVVGFSVFYSDAYHQFWATQPR
jgi:ketosteroid isomerase-like protein